MHFWSKIPINAPKPCTKLSQKCWSCYRRKGWAHSKPYGLRMGFSSSLFVCEDRQVNTFGNTVHVCLHTDFNLDSEQSRVFTHGNRAPVQSSKIQLQVAGCGWSLKCWLTSWTRKIQNNNAAWKRLTVAAMDAFVFNTWFHFSSSYVLCWW